MLLLNYLWSKRKLWLCSQACAAPASVTLKRPGGATGPMRTSSSSSRRVDGWPRRSRSLWRCPAVTAPLPPPSGCSLHGSSAFKFPHAKTPRPFKDCQRGGLKLKRNSFFFSLSVKRSRYFKWILLFLLNFNDCSGSVKSWHSEVKSWGQLWMKFGKH